MGGERRKNLLKATKLIGDAARGGAEMALLPETLDLGWTNPAAVDQAEPIPGGEPYSVLTEAAAEHGIFVCAGLTERDGEDVFNSGLLGEGAVYDLVITNAGFHPYYCIPHGSPGGIGMAGSITVVEDCDDGDLNMQFSFDVENGGFSGYEVFVDGNFENNYNYQNENPQFFELTLPANGQDVNILIQDLEDNTCLIDSTFQMPNCSDPCFGFVRFLLKLYRF